MIYAYVIMKNHLHMVARSENMSKEIARFRSFTARRIIDTLNKEKENNLLVVLSNAKAVHKKDRAFQVWQEGSHPQMIQNETMIRQKIDYIHQNPVKSGLVDDPVKWEYSSAANYAGNQGFLKVEREW